VKVSPKRKQNKKKGKAKQRYDQTPHFGGITANVRSSPLPPRHRTTLGWTDQFTLDVSTADTIDNTVFRLNSCYDPDYTGAGTQPIGFDELSGLYLRYRVVGCRVKLMTISSLSSPVVEVISYPSISPSLVSVSAPCRMQGIRYSDFVVHGHSQPITIVAEQDFRMADLFGVSESAILNETGYSALTSSTPANVAYFHVAAMARSSSSQSMLGYFNVEFDVIFEELRALQES